MKKTRADSTSVETALALHRTAKQPLDDEALHQEKEEQNRQRDDARSRHQQVPAECVFLLETGEPDWKCEKLVRLQEHERAQKLVPAADESEHRHGSKTGAGERQDNPMKGEKLRCAVDRSGLLQLLRYRLEEAAH